MAGIWETVVLRQSAVLPGFVVVDRNEITNRMLSSALRFQVAGISAAVFEKWRNAASVVYQVSIDDDLVDASRLKSDLIESIGDAAASLVDDKGDDKKQNPGWSLGYFYGHIQGTLNIRWTYEYITRQSDDFKAFMALKATWHYLNFDRAALARIARLYEWLLDAHGLEQMSTVSPSKGTDIAQDPVVSLRDYADAKNSSHGDIAHNDVAETLLPQLEKEVDERIGQLLHSRTIQCLGDVDSFFDDELVIELIGRAHFA